MSKSIEELAADVDYAHMVKEQAEEAYKDALAEWADAHPNPGSIKTDRIIINRAKDGTRKTFNKTRFTAVYGAQEYERFVDEKPQAGSVSVRKITAKDSDQGGGF